VANAERRRVNFIVGEGKEPRGETRGEKKRETRKKETPSSVPPLEDEQPSTKKQQ
jgi:hypothetical protein